MSNSLKFYHTPMYVLTKENKCRFTGSSMPAGKFLSVADWEIFNLLEQSDLVYGVAMLLPDELLTSNEEIYNIMDGEEEEDVDGESDDL